MGVSGLRTDKVGRRSVGPWRTLPLLALMVLLLLGACAGPGAQPTPTPGLDLGATETPPPPAPTSTRAATLTETPRPIPTATPRSTAPATATRRPTSVPTGPTAPPLVLSNPTKLTRVGSKEEVYPLVAVGGAAGNTLLVAGKGVKRSGDKGETWHETLDQVEAPNVTALVIAPSNPQVVYVGVGEACERAEERPGFVSKDGGLKWEAIGNNLRSIAVDPKDHELVYAVDCRGLVRSTNGGRTWSVVAENPIPAGAKALIAIAASSSQVLYLAIEPEPRKVKIVRTADRGKTWQGVTPKIDGTTQVGQELLGAEENAAATASRALVIDATNSAVVLISTAHGVFRTSDGGATWTMTDEGLEETVLPASTKVQARINTALVGDPSKSGAYWIGTGAEDVEGVGVYRTRDRGETWRKPATGLEGKQVFSLALGGVAGARLLYIATDDGLWVMTAP